MGVHLQLLKKQPSSASLEGSRSGGSSPPMPPKGCMAVRVVGPGGGEEEEEERFVVPVGYLKHPLFVALLKAAEDEYGFEQKGAITIPCGVDHFRHVQGIIQHQKHHHHISSGFVSGDGGHHGHHISSGFVSGDGGHHGHHNNHHHFHIAGCFRA